MRNTVYLLNINPSSEEANKALVFSVLIFLTFFSSDLFSKLHKML